MTNAQALGGGGKILGVPICAPICTMKIWFWPPKLAAPATAGAAFEMPSNVTCNVINAPTDAPSCQRNGSRMATKGAYTGNPDPLRAFFVGMDVGERHQDSPAAATLHWYKSLAARCAGDAPGTQVSATAVPPHRGHFRKPCKRQQGNRAPRVQIRLSRSRIAS